MGNYFVMSKRFNKCKAEDFGFVVKDMNTAINPIDNSIWIKANLYDFGWGKEIGFYKSPLPEFDSLIEIALYSTNGDDRYGAAAIILEKYAEDLLAKCETYMKDSVWKKEFKKMVELFDLKVAINRCPIYGKTYEQIQIDYSRWKMVTQVALKV